MSTNEQKLIRLVNRAIAIAESAVGTLETLDSEEERCANDQADLNKIHVELTEIMEEVVS